MKKESPYEEKKEPKQAEVAYTGILSMKNPIKRVVEKPIGEESKEAA